MRDEGSIMAGVQRFEDLIARQKARTLTRCSYQVTRSGTLARDYGLANQMQRAAVSVMANIAEGFERSAAAEFQHFLSIARSSCAELRAELYTACDVEHITPSESIRI
ncbi:MAG: four helix bundle protein [Anaerolineae bacterium]